ncbi:MAG: GGDEF domain-containing protein, partial [Proteobacteria bacterium]|nr:GGDEF domain-containing protein [Pseudomonadota bacterium]
MEYSESLEKASQYARSAFSLMESKAIPTTPNNFAVWFVYCSGRYPDLTRALDKLLKENKEFTEARNAEIFDQYFTFIHEGTAATDAAEKVGSELANILAYLESAGADTAEYGKFLESITGKVAGSGSVSDFKALIGDALSATRSMEGQTKGLQEKLDTSSKEISQLKQDLEDMRLEAMTDALTAIPNRKLFDIQLRQSANDAAKDGEELCLLMVDIDHFKKFNDTYGHQVGDQVLKLLGSTLTACIKGQDTAARYGGEEFAIILPYTSLKDALTVAENIRRAVGTKKVVNRTTGEDLGTITVSIGAGR